eukprot:4505090-Prorocentrum_lima.AAC.1
MQEAIRRSIAETGDVESGVGADVAMAIAGERSLLETSIDRNVDTGASSSSTPIVKNMVSP